MLLKKIIIATIIISIIVMPVYADNVAVSKDDWQKMIFNFFKEATHEDNMSKVITHDEVMVALRTQERFKQGEEIVTVKPDIVLKYHDIIEPVEIDKDICDVGYVCKNSYTVGLLLSNCSWQREIYCPGGCLNGNCKMDLCHDVKCPDRCSGDILEENGACNNGVCYYESTKCDNGCDNSQCLIKECSDSDGGVEELEKGITRGVPSSMYNDDLAIDYCNQNAGNLVEFYLGDDCKILYEEIPCNNGCSDGVCLPAGQVNSTCSKESDCTSALDCKQDLYTSSKIFGTCCNPSQCSFDSICVDQGFAFENNFCDNGVWYELQDNCNSKCNDLQLQCCKGGLGYSNHKEEYDSSDGAYECWEDCMVGLGERCAADDQCMSGTCKEMGDYPQQGALCCSDQECATTNGCFGYGQIISMSGKNLICDSGVWRNTTCEDCNLITAVCTESRCNQLGCKFSDSSKVVSCTNDGNDCSETDNGIDDSVKGSVMGNPSVMYSDNYATDYCLTDKKLKEFYLDVCDIYYMNITCNGECADGRCIDTGSSQQSYCLNPPNVNEAYSIKYIGDQVELNEGWYLANAKFAGVGLLYEGKKISAEDLFGDSSNYGCGDKIRKVWHFNFSDRVWTMYSPNEPGMSDLEYISDGEIYSIQTWSSCVLKHPGNGQYRSSEICLNGCQDGQCSNTCNDSDEGYNIFLSGRVEGNPSSMYNDDYATDYCKSATTLREFYLDSCNIVYKDIVCVAGCQEGACNKVCNDTDGGNDIFTSSQVLGYYRCDDSDLYNEQGTFYCGMKGKGDFCFPQNPNDGTYDIFEYYCGQDGLLTRVRTTCPNQCINDACTS